MLTPGLAAKVSLPTGENKERWVVPKDALQLGGATPVVLESCRKKAVLMIPVKPAPPRSSAAHPSRDSRDSISSSEATNEVRPGQRIIVNR